MSGEAGFGMVELLVALAICAVLAMGAGSLIGLGLKLRDRVELTTEVQQALLDLRAVSSAFGGGAWVGLGDRGDESFQLCRGGSGLDLTFVGAFALSADHASYSTAFASSTADISVFETQALEYLVVTPTEQRWRSADELAGARPVAARLTLGLGARTWRMLLWIAQPRPVPGGRGEFHCTA